MLTSPSAWPSQRGPGRCERPVPSHLRRSVGRTLHIVFMTQYDTGPTASLKSHLGFHRGNLSYALAYHASPTSSSVWTLGQTVEWKGANQDNFANQRAASQAEAFIRISRRYADRREDLTGSTGQFARPTLIWVGKWRLCIPRWQPLPAWWIEACGCSRPLVANR